MEWREYLFALKKNHTVGRHSGGVNFLFICIKKQIIRLAVIQAEWIFLFFLYFNWFFKGFFMFFEHFVMNSDLLNSIHPRTPGLF